MTSDLVSACIFCAKFLLAPESLRMAGYSAEISATYSTLGRRVEPDRDLTDSSDTTGKFVLIGLGNAAPAAGGLGAGTPAMEWRLKVAIAPSHDQQKQTRASNDPFESSGSGRYENFSALLRYPVGARDSVEGALSRRYLEPTDLVTRGLGASARVEERRLSADRTDWGFGWRHRFSFFETAAALRHVIPNGSHTTAGSFQINHGSLWGADVEARYAAGRLTASLRAERTAGSLDVLEKSQPDFVGRVFSAPASLEAVSLSGAYRFTKTDASLTVTYERSRLPFVSAAVTGTETERFEQGYHPDSRTHQTAVEIEVGRFVVPSIRAKVFLRAAQGGETVLLTDPAGILPRERLDVGRDGVFGGGLSRRLGSPEIMLGIGADFWLWRQPGPGP
jgi:hypothetical protein